jgi:predicted phosphohydrolase
MRIQLASDLHMEFLRRTPRADGLIPDAPDADVLVLAGDVAVALDVVDHFGDWPVPVVYIAGNHEFYGHDIDVIRAGLKDVCAGTSVRFLDNEAMVVNGVRFLGSTLWTDYRLYEPHCSQSAAMRVAGQALNDHRLIKRGAGAFTPEQALTEHVAARTWLAEQLCTSFDGKTVVVTHHAPHAGSVHQRYSNDPLTAAFVSDLRELLPLASLWMHGHVHDGFDYLAHGCRVVANPRGYPLLPSRGTRSELLFENAAFEPMLVVEV